MPSLILIADHDPVQRRLLEAMVRRFGYQSESVDTGQAALARLSATGEPAVSLLILDLFLADLGGLAVMAEMRDRRITLPVIVETVSSQIDLVMSAMRAGAHDFVVQPVGAERLHVSIKNALRFRALQDETRRATRRSAGAIGFRHIFTQSEDMARAIRLGERAARAHLPVLIEGEAGVGKHLFARAIQSASDRRGRPFLSVNCAALAPEQADTLLFGCETGSEKAQGKFAEAHGGALFLDEVGLLPLPLQAKLLRLIQDGEIDVPGMKRPAKIDVRLISATSQNLIEQVKAGFFREDLYYRLNVFPVTLPPLRARAADIGGLAQRFAQRFAAEEGKSIRGVSAEALQLLSRYEWPGNVRQLENAVFRAVVLSEADELGVAEFPQIAARVAGYDVRVPAAPAMSPSLAAPPLRAAHADGGRLNARDPHVLRLLDEQGHARRLVDMEGELIRFALAHYRGQMSEMARRLGIGRSTLYRKLKDLGLHDGEEGADAETGVAA
jgi:DNA-binding NtrC family response regulator